MNIGSSTEGRSLRSGESTAVCSSKPLEQEDQDPLFPKKIFTMEQLRKGVATVQPKSTHVQYLKGLGHEKSMALCKTSKLVSMLRASTRLISPVALKPRK